MEEPIRRRRMTWRSWPLPVLVAAGVVALLAVVIIGGRNEWDSIPVPDLPVSALSVSGGGSGPGAHAPVAELGRLYAACDSEKRGERGLVTSATSSADGQRLVTTSLSGVARFWVTESVDACRWKRDFVAGHPLYNAAHSSDGKHVALMGEASSVTILDAADGTPTRRIDTRRAAVMSATFSADARWLATVSWGSSVQLWALESGKQAALLETPARARWAEFSADGDTVLVGVEGGGFVGWRRRGFRLDPRIQLRPELLLVGMGLAVGSLWVWCSPRKGPPKSLSIFNVRGRLP